MTLEVNGLDQFQQEVLNYDGFVLVDFWAEWCGPCKFVSPIIDQLGEKYKDKIKVVKVDVDKNPELQSKYQIFSIPNIMLFKGGATGDSKGVEAYPGARPESFYVQWLTAAGALGSSSPAGS